MAAGNSTPSLNSPVIKPYDEPAKALTAEPSQQAHTEQNPVKAFLNDTFSDPVSVFTLFLVGSTILLWLATLKLAREARASAIEQLGKMERQNHIADDTAKRQLRAYVTTEDHDIIGFWRGGPTELRTKIYNRGQTPAYDLKVWSIVGGALEEPDNFKVKQKKRDDFRQSRSMLGPGQWVLHSNDCQSPLNGDAYASIVAGGLSLVFAGVITYRDTFGRRHFTTFKQFYRGRGNFKTTTDDLTACGNGNNAS